MYSRRAFHTHRAGLVKPLVAAVFAAIALLLAPCGEALAADSSYSLPEGWTKVTGTLIKTTFGARAQELERENPGAFTNSGHSNVLEMNEPLYRFALDVPTEIGAIYQDTLGEHYTTCTADNLQLSLYDASVLDSYKSGQHMTIAINPTETRIIRGIFSSFGPSVGEFKILNDAGGSTPAPTPTPEPSPDPVPGASSKSGDVYRLYNPYSSEHIYTTDRTERDSLIRSGWNNEGVAWCAPSGGAPIYRLFNPYSNEHYYAASLNEAKGLKNAGWRLDFDGKAAFNGASSGTSVYQVFNPYETKNTHLWTTDYNEYQDLQLCGWKGEGVKWYGV